MLSIKPKYYRFAFWLWLTAIMILTYIPSLPNPKIEIEDGEYLRLDYVGHLVFYTVLVILFFLWKRSWVSSKKQLLYCSIVVLLVGLVFAVLNEVFQQYVPGRRYNPLDMFYNGLGVVLGMLVIVVFRKRQKYNKAKGKSKKAKVSV